jgi:hypothetical protein
MNSAAGAVALALGHQGVVVTSELLQRVAAMPRHEKAHRVELPQAGGAGEHLAPVEQPPCRRQRFLPLTGHLRQQASWPWSLAPHRCLSSLLGLPRNLCLFPIALTPLFFRHSSWMAAMGTK